MSSTSEEAPISNPLEGLEALAAASRRPGEPPRLATIGDGPFARAFKAEPPRLATSAGDRLESAMSDFVRRQIKPTAMPEPIDFRRESNRRTLIAGAVGVAAALAVASVAALLFVTQFPRDGGIERFFAAASKMPRTEETSNDALAQSRALVPGVGGDQSVTHEQSERLLQQFVQWRQKAALTDKP